MVKVFVTGSPGWIGSQLIPELITAGHTVTVLSRSEATDEKIKSSGATAVRGDLLDLEALKAGATGMDAVIHVPTIFDSKQSGSTGSAFIAVDKAATAAISSGLKKGGIFMKSHGTVSILPNQVLTEDNPIQAPNSPTFYDELKADGFVPIVIRLATLIYGSTEAHTLAAFIELAKSEGFVSFVEDGNQRWSAIHVKDAAKIIVLALERGEEGIYHAATEEGISTRAISEVVAKRLELPLKTLTEKEAEKCSNLIGLFLMYDSPVSDKLTREKLGFVPTGTGVIKYLNTTETDFA